MNYEEFKRLWLWALGESRLAILGVDPLEEMLDLRSTERTCKSFVDPHKRQHPEPFHVSAALESRWDALLSARTRSNEQDMLEWLLGPDRRNARTERPWASHRHYAARVDDLGKGDTGAIARGMDPMGSRNHAPTRAHRSYRAR
jgi:hypothetical protein